MAKDPAVLFYTSDFLTGTAFFTDEQRGQYIRLLCEQHQNGRIPENHMVSVCFSLDSPVVKKFVKDDQGNYYNERMEEEIIKRREFTESRRNNGKLGGRPKASDKPKGKASDKATDNLFGNENENDNISKNVIEYLNQKTGKKFKPSTNKTKSCIKARINEGFNIDDFKKVIDNKSKDWLNDEKMTEYLRPETLFGNKFEGYLNSQPEQPQKQRVKSTNVTFRIKHISGEIKTYYADTEREAKEKFCKDHGVTMDTITLI